MKAKLFFLLLTLSGVNYIPAASATLSTNEEVLVNYIDQHKTDQLKLLENMVNINSGTENSQGVKKIGEMVRPEFESMGFKTKWVELPATLKHAGSLVATHSGSGKQILLIGHLDTVFPDNSPFQSFTLSADQKFATGPGVIDDKGGVVTILYSLKALQHAGKLKNANITVVLIGDEEQAAKPTEISRKALRAAAQGSDIALGFEFSLAEDQLVTNRRGLSEWYLASTGKSRHSSTVFGPESGDGAIYETARVLNAFRTAFAETSVASGLTLNPGLIVGGQTASEDVQQNTGSASGKKTVIAAQTLVHGDLRFYSEDQKNKAEQKMRDIAGTSLPLTSSQLTFKDIMPAMTETDGNRQLLAQFSAINTALGGPQLKSVPAAERGGSDVSYIAQTVSASIDGLGPWGKGAHGQNETLEIASLPVVTKRAAIFISRYLAQ
ncbi:M20 family metallopeptidase [Erwinia amylovora]|uniref:M20 family metallopeptidase n=1 Tax=Erwinia amylovora TaxID=552 RepID=UPI00320B8921